MPTHSGSFGFREGLEKSKMEIKNMKCQSCKGKKKQRTRQYKVINTVLNEVVRRLWLCDSCVFPLLYAQLKREAHHE
jgi:C4-type Zn-finger protein